jgi:predicted  nucleic acid-binding Zn-ribbon protein
MEEKVSNLESKTPDMDRRIAELMGTLAGLSDEMQAQVRRADTMETKLWEWRRKHEDDFRLAEETREERFQQTFSNSRVIAATCEDCHKRLTQQLQNLEADLTERMAAQDQLKVGFMQLCQKVDLAFEGNGPASQKNSRGNALEDTHAPATNGRDGDLATLLEVLDERIGGMTEKVDAVFKDMHEIHGKLATHAENIKSCRTSIDARESQNRVLQERLDRGDFEGKVDHLQRLAQEEAKNRTNYCHRIEAMERRVNMQEVAPDENVARSPGSNSSANGDGRTLKTCILASAIHECRTRIEQCEERVEILDEEFAASRDDVRIQSHVEKICEQLQLVVPKVIEHEGFINEQRAR